jgi:hypothetical protein
VDEKTLTLALGGTGLAVIGLGMLILYGGGPPPAPERPKPPPPPEQLMNSELKYSAPVYRALVEQDAKAWGIVAPAPEEMREPFPYFDELRGKRRLKVKQPVDTAHLRLTLEITKKQANIEGQSYRADHLILRIENKTPKYLAYRVVTSVPDKNKCMSKGDIPHNAIVIAPNETLQRSECLYRNEEAVDLHAVETIELPQLAAIYVSRLPPTVVFYDRRTSEGHVPINGAICPQTFSWREIREGVERNEFDWRDLIDFYARHNCDEYSFFRSYRYRTDATAPLPARPM